MTFLEITSFNPPIKKKKKKKKFILRSVNNAIKILLFILIK